MKAKILILFFLLAATFLNAQQARLVAGSSHAQSSLDSLRLVLPIGHTDDLNCIRISKDENYIATANSYFPYYYGSTYAHSSDKNVIIWNKNGVPLHILPHNHMVNFLSEFIHERNLIISTEWGDSDAFIWDISTGQLIKKMTMWGDFPNVLSSNLIQFRDLNEGDSYFFGDSQKQRF